MNNLTHEKETQVKNENGLDLDSLLVILFIYNFGDLFYFKKNNVFAYLLTFGWVKSNGDIDR